MRLLDTDRPFPPVMWLLISLFGGIFPQALYEIWLGLFFAKEKKPA